MEFENAFFNTKDYKLLKEKLGEGAFGSVYIAENTIDHQQYAAKIINTISGFDGREQMLFLRESLLLHKLDHPSIVKFIGINFKSLKDSDEFKPTIITEYLPHGSLKNNLDKERRSLADPDWNPTKKYITLLGISDAMRYLHAHGIVHRDLKPDNVLTDSNYYPRVCDFGLSRCFPVSLTNSMQLTMTGQLGTPLYMAPEILRGEKKFGPAVDVFAFGILAYEIVTGKVPYYELGEISPYILANNVMSGYRPMFPDNVPSKMRKLIESCWSHDPSDRPSFDEIFEKLSGDFSYSEETVDEDEVGEYIISLEEGRKGDREKSTEQYSHLISLHKEVEELKEKCRNYEVLLSTNDDFINGLNCIHGKDADIPRAVSSLELSSEGGNCYASYLLGLLYEKGELVKGDFHKSLGYYEKSGQQRNPRGYNYVGFIYEEGREVEQSYKKAIEYYQKAADLGNADSMNSLGLLYAQGREVEQSYEKAIEYYKKAADLGNADSLINLGRLYENGKGVEQNYEKAAECYQKVADLGNASAMNSLGVLYTLRTGIEKNYEKAIEYFQKAADLGNANAMNNLGRLYEKGRGVEQNYDKAIEYYDKAADLGNTKSMNNLGFLYIEGRGVEQNYDKAIEYFQKSADFENADAMINLGRLYEKGRGVKQSYDKAIEYFQKAANLGNTYAMNNLGLLYSKGKGVEQNYMKAIEYFKKAADLGDVDAMNNIGLLYSQGRGVEQSYAKAIEYYEKAANLGNAKAMNNLGLLYAQGKGVEQNYKKAIEYFQKAADLGNADAIENMKKLNKK